MISLVIRIGVRISVQRHHRLDGTFRQSSVSNLASAGTADAPRFTDGKVWKVIMEDEFLFVAAAGVGIKFLGVLARPQRRQRHRLRLTAGKNGRTMRARGKNSSPQARNCPHRVHRASVQSLALIQNQGADVFLLQIIGDVLFNTNSVTFSAPYFSTSFLPTSSKIALTADSRFNFPGVNSAGTIRSPASALASLKISSGTILTLMSRFFLPAAAISFFCASINGWQHSCPNFNASLKSASCNLLRRAFIHHDVLRIADVN